MLFGGLAAALGTGRASDPPHESTAAARQTTDDPGSKTVIPGYDVPWFTFRPGGLISGFDYTAWGVIGLHDSHPGAGGQSGGGYVVSGGYVSGVRTATALSCPGDCNGDGQVNTTDLLALLSQWGTDGNCDFNATNSVEIGDLLMLLSGWGPCGL
jgi:hypothetical protein